MAVGHSGRPLGCDDHRHVEAVVAEGSSGAGYTEGLCQSLPGLLTEDGVHQLDNLVLWEEQTEVLNVIYYAVLAIRTREANTCTWSKFPNNSRSP